MNGVRQGRKECVQGKDDDKNEEGERTKWRRERMEDEKDRRADQGGQEERRATVLRKMRTATRRKGGRKIERDERKTKKVQKKP